MKNSLAKSVFLYATAVAMTVVALFPIYWMLNTSLKGNTEIYQINPTFWPRELTFEAY